MGSEEVRRIKAHWDQVAKTRGEAFDEVFPLGYAGTYKDYNLQHLEMDSILNYLKPGDRVADIGCGKGYSALYMAWKKKIRIVGIDYSEEMVGLATKNMEELSRKGELAGEADFAVGDVMEERIYPGEFDVIYTERCLINLPTWDEQKDAIRKLANCISSGGLFLMLEGSKPGINKLNDLRASFGLKAIPVVWHNLFFDDEQLISYASGFLDFVKVDDFCSTYMIISRALHPALVSPAEPDYKSKINKLALQLPNLGDLGYQKIFVFKKQ
jgi:SAM-dependent methyltransferase